MKKMVFFIICNLTSLNLIAEGVVDVFGTDSKTATEIVKKYGEKVAKMADQMFQNAKHSDDKKIKAALDSVYQKKLALAEKLRKEYGFSYVEFDTLAYSAYKPIYTTIEVINSKDKDRLQFVTPLTVRSSKPSKKQDLIEDMVRFQFTSGHLIVNHQVNSKQPECPVFHCLPGFYHPQLQKKFASFKDAETQKNLILRTAKTDQNPDRRTAAIFLMGHFKDPREIISMVIPKIRDKDWGVRNAAMRVLSMTMKKAKIYDIDPTPFIDFLDSPFATDRNKSLGILLQAAKSKEGKRLIQQKGKEKLIALLQLKQPCNRNESYRVLKAISGKSFKSTDIAAWKQWKVSEGRAVG